MKKIIHSSKKWVWALLLCCAFSIIGSLATPLVASADNETVIPAIDADQIASDLSGKYNSVDQIQTKVVDTLSDWEAFLVNVSIAGAPFMVIVILFLLMWSKEPRKIAGLIGVCGIILAAFIAILVVHSGAVVEIVTGLLK